MARTRSVETYPVERSLKSKREAAKNSELPGESVDFILRFADKCAADGLTARDTRDASFGLRDAVNAEPICVPPVHLHKSVKLALGDGIFRIR